VSYKKANLEESHLASFAVLTATYAVLERPPKSLAEGTSYLRIVFAFADYCLTCSVALSCFRGSASGPVLLVFRRVSFAFRTVYTPHIPTRTYIDVFLRLDIYTRTRCTMSFGTHSRLLSILQMSTIKLNFGHRVKV